MRIAILSERSEPKDLSCEPANSFLAEPNDRYHRNIRKRPVCPPISIGIDRSQIMRNPIARFVGKDRYRMIDASTI